MLLLGNGAQVVQEEGWGALILLTLLSSAEAFVNAVVQYSPVAFEFTVDAAKFVYAQAKVPCTVYNMYMYLYIVSKK